MNSQTRSQSHPTVDPGLAGQPSAGRLLSQLTEVADPESCPLCPQEVQDAIARYRPRVCTAALFPLLREVLRESLTAFAPPNGTSGVTGPGAHLARFLVWMLGRPERAAMGGPISVDELFEPGLIDAT